MKQQQRFIVALVVSAAVLILWNYAFPPVKPPQPNANANANANAQPATTSSPQPTSQPTTSATPTQTAKSPAPTAEPNPQRKLRIVTPLYEATLDTHGAVATSWIITRNKNTGREIYAASSTKSNPQPLELVPTPPDGVSPAAYELDRYEQIFRSIALEPHPVFELTFRWLRSRLPTGNPAERKLVHGDYRIGNILFGPDGMRLVLDWEIAHAGDPIEDMGFLCIRSWRFGGEYRAAAAQVDRVRQLRHADAFQRRQDIDTALV